jgi:hypothetical protein
VFRILSSIADLLSYASGEYSTIDTVSFLKYLSESEIERGGV